MGSHAAFFYGTLMAPPVLHRVCHGSLDPANPVYALHNFRTRAALLPGFRRHRVRGADYPAILPCADAGVRGTCVTGLTDGDLWRLDLFEGAEYRREKVRVRILGTAAKGFEGEAEKEGGGERQGKGEEVKGEVEEDEEAEGGEVEVETYVWIAGEDALEDEEWDFAQFQREKMRFWVGAEGAGEYAEVDEAVAAAERDGTGGRGVNGHITNALNEEHKKAELLRNAV